MPIIQLFVVLIVLAVALGVVTTYIPMSPPIRNIIIGLAILFALALILQAFGLLGGFSTVRVR